MALYGRIQTNVSQEDWFIYYLMILWLSCFMLYVYVGNAGFDSWQGQETSLFSKTSRLPLVPTQPPMQRVPRIFPPWRHSGWGVKTTTHLHLVSWLRMNGGIPRSPCTHSCCGLGQLYLSWNCIQKNILHCVHICCIFSVNVIIFVFEVPLQNTCAICINRKGNKVNGKMTGTVLWQAAHVYLRIPSWTPEAAQCRGGHSAWPYHTV